MQALLRRLGGSDLRGPLLDRLGSGGLGQAGNPDVVDAIAALIAAGAYVYKQIALSRAIKINRRNAAPQEPQDGRSQDGEGDWSYPTRTAPLAASTGAAGIP